MPVEPRLKVLVVDDAPQNVKLLRAILRAADYQVIEAGSGREALAKIAAERPEAVILDVRMPGMSGYEVCEQIRADPDSAWLPVIMVTALSMPEERIRGIEAGATDFITKPFNKRELLARLRGSVVQARNCGFFRLRLPLVVVDSRGLVVEATAQAAALLGLPPEELAGRPFAEMAQREGPEGGLRMRLTPVAGSDGRALAQVALLERISG